MTFRSSGCSVAAGDAARIASSSPSTPATFGPVLFAEPTEEAADDLLELAIVQLTLPDGGGRSS
jgi:hypothetical protein